MNDRTLPDAEPRRGDRVRVLLLGATGMLGRPGARRLAADPSFEVSALVRNMARAHELLSDGVKVVNGDLRDPDSLRVAMQGIDTVYLSLNTPFDERATYDPDRDGTLEAIKAAKESGVRRLIRLSALEVEFADESDWWALKRKADTDRAVMDSGLAWTIMRPAWFMESLPLFAVVAKHVFMAPMTPPVPLWWISGEDYASQVARAILEPRSEGKALINQGRDAATFMDAARRFARALPWRALTAPLPRFALRMAAIGSPQARYLDDLLALTLGHAGTFRAQETIDLLGECPMTIEGYAKSLERTGDWPSK